MPWVSRWPAQAAGAASGRWLVRDLPDVHELQTERTHPIQQGVQAGLVQVTAENSCGGLHFYGHVGESITSCRAKRSNHSYLVTASDDGASFRIRGRDSAMLAAIPDARITRLR